ncbi:MAG: hypothetical protein AVDCRST_MAG68-637, partial [uncultured Gemmatimonadetes bacterium]
DPRQTGGFAHGARGRSGRAVRLHVRRGGAGGLLSRAPSFRAGLPQAVPGDGLLHRGGRAAPHLHPGGGGGGVRLVLQDGAVPGRVRDRLPHLRSRPAGQGLHDRGAYAAGAPPLHHHQGQPAAGHRDPRQRLVAARGGEVRLPQRGNPARRRVPGRRQPRRGAALPPQERGARRL